VQLSQRLYKLKPITSTSEMMWHWECGRDCEVNWNCKKLPFFGKWTTKNTEGRDCRTPDTAMHRLHNAHLLYNASEQQSCDPRKCGIFWLQNAEKQQGVICKTFHTWLSANYPDNFPHPAFQSNPIQCVLTGAGSPLPALYIALRSHTNWYTSS